MLLGQRLDSVQPEEHITLSTGDKGHSDISTKLHERHNQQSIGTSRWVREATNTVFIYCRRIDRDIEIYVCIYIYIKRERVRKFQSTQAGKARHRMHVQRKQLLAAAVRNTVRCPLSLTRCRCCLLDSKANLFHKGELKTGSAKIHTLRPFLRKKRK